MSDYDVWYRYKKRFDHEGAHFMLQGHAISARVSGFWIPEFHVMFDAGMCSPFNPLYIFITHGHSDHSYCLPVILTGITTKPNVYVPRGTAQLYRNLMIAKHQLSRCDANVAFDVDAVCTFVEVGDGDEIPIKVLGGTPMIVKVFATDHKVQSVGYALFHVRSRLKAEFSSLAGKDLAQKRKEGVELSTLVHVACVAYVGDSTPKWLSHRMFTENLFPVVICECTFVGELEGDGGIERARDAAREHGHSCWSELGPLITAHNAPKSTKTLFVLVHWSNRYEKTQIESFFKDIPNVFAWTN